ncbi:siderophore-iron reductase FhuF [Neobacillus cucumis]|uniref:Siderophore-iron reductase FhuF n=1 Tax=Neobacillus cucumis TaxID=1740721 RepID=A0A2N5HAX1_9BACI|nr:siderophore-iron reductase FhuF [Neobacillus cucumis]PLS02630.1 siderophore-iron reductase FhuF [Neobacillus cucumis]
MGNNLLEAELTQLEKYRFSSDLPQSFMVKDLLKDEYLKDFLKKLTAILGAPNEKATASIFIKRYAFVAVMSLYTMTAWNKRLDVSLSNIKMESPKTGEDWLPSFSLVNDKLQPWDGTKRPHWRQDIVKSLFAENLELLIRKLEKTVGISRLILWENIAVYLFWLFEKELKDHPSAHVLDDFNYMLFQAEGGLFGTYKRNPLLRYYGMKTNMVEWNEEVRIRSTCCFSYQLPAGKRCKTCPCTQIAKDGRCQDGEGIYCSIRSIT